MVIKNGTDEDRLTMAELLEQYDEARFRQAARHERAEAAAKRGRKRIYGNFLSKLEEPKTLTANGRQMAYPYIYNRYGNKGTIYFPMVNMETLGLLDGQDIDYLKTHSRRNRKYES